MPDLINRMALPYRTTEAGTLEVLLITSRMRRRWSAPARACSTTSSAFPIRDYDRRQARLAEQRREPGGLHQQRNQVSSRAA
jgi:hypothetical protein